MAIEALSDYLGPKHPFRRLKLLDSDWFFNGGGTAYDSMSDHLQFCLDYFKSLPIYIRTSHTINDLPVVISHTCLNQYSYDILNATQDDLRKHATSFVWSRSQAGPVAQFFNIYGHTPTDCLGHTGAVPIISNTGINLDTGCVYHDSNRGKLTAVLLPSMQIIQQERL